MIGLRMVAIAGAQASRTSSFLGGAKDVFSPGNYYLGATDQQMYQQAKDLVVQFDQLVERTKRIANQTAREQVIKDYGLDDPTNRDKAQYMRNAVASDIAQVESYSPPNYLIYEAKGPAKSRPTKLADFITSFHSDVQNAETQYGILPAPVEITKYVTLSQVPWVPILVVGGVAMVGLVALGVIKFK
jgi:hypothetical protein